MSKPTLKRDCAKTSSDMIGGSYIPDTLLVERIASTYVLSPRKISMPRRRAKKKRRPAEILGLLAIAAFVLGLVWLVFFTSPPNSDQTTSATLSNLAADFVLTDVDGKVFRLSDHRGQIVVLEFMRTTCEACIVQESGLRELQPRFGAAVSMAMISVDPTGDTAEVLREHRDKSLPGWTAMRDTSGVYGDYSVRATPTLFIIDKNGQIAYQHVGVTESSVLINEISNLT